MVSRKQSDLVLQKSLCTLLTCIAISGGVGYGADNGRKFYPDDPMTREPPPRPVRNLERREVDDIYDFVVNMYVTPKRQGRVIRTGPQPAQNTNTLGEVPDGAWYSNRHFFHRMSIEELQRGPGNSTPPSRRGAWSIIAAKTDGITPGFAIEDADKNQYLLKLDPPEYPELCSAADVIGSKMFYALGYDTPENYIVHFRREDLEIREGVMWRDSSGKKRLLTRRVLNELLKPQPTGTDGSYRGLASKWIAGRIVGPFSYEGTRTDDPNDVLPHEDRRELRGLRVFSAWLNHQDTRSINTMDSLLTENGIQYVKHYLMDFGSILGSAGVGPKLPWFGHEYVIDRKGAALQAATFGFYPPRWVRSDYPKLRGVGLLDYWSFDPVSWKPTYPNPAFLRMNDEDAFWAAKQVAAFSDDEIRAVVRTGELTDPRASEWIAECLIRRRDKIAETWLSKFLPVDKFNVVNGEITFEDVAANHTVGTRRTYGVHWSSYDGQGELKPLPNSAGRKVPVAGNAEYLAATIRQIGEADGSSLSPVMVYLRRNGTGFKVVGISR